MTYAHYAAPPVATSYATRKLEPDLWGCNDVTKKLELRVANTLPLLLLPLLLLETDSRTVGQTKCDLISDLLKMAIGHFLIFVFSLPLYNCKEISQSCMAVRFS